MTYISVDVEADGPIPGDYSMIALGAIPVKYQKKGDDDGFLAYIKPISDKWNPEALNISGFSREETLEFHDPAKIMKAFCGWVEQFEPPWIFVADNNGFDWQFVNWYLHHFVGRNPFGWSSRNINDIFHGIKGDMRASFKNLRRTKHDHNPLNDAKGNAEALREMIHRYDLRGVK